MHIVSQSRTAQVVYQDLLRLHLDEAVSGVVGSLEERLRNGRTYPQLYSTHRFRA